MGILVSKNYINSNYTLRPTGTPSTDAYQIACCSWIVENYYAAIGNGSGGAGYYDCGYGCQYYTYDPGCSPCSAGYDDNRCPSSDEIYAIYPTTFNYANGGWTFDYATLYKINSTIFVSFHSANNYTAIVAKVNVYDENSTLVDSTELYSGSYTANTTLTYYPTISTTVPIPEYGWNVSVIIEEPY